MSKIDARLNNIIGSVYMPGSEQDNLNLKNMQKYFDEANEFFKKNPKESIYSSPDEKVNVIKTNTTLNKSNMATELVAYRKDMLLGEGGFAAVYTGIREGGEVVAVKYSNFTQKSKTDNLNISLLKRLKKQEISALKALGQFRANLQCVEKTNNGSERVDFTVMRLEKGQNLQDLLLSNLDKEQKFLSQTQKAQLSLKAVYAIYFMHSHQILHRDIKPENFMAWLDENNESSVPVIDTGLAIALSKKKKMKTIFVGTPGFIAPEVLSDWDSLVYSKKTDIFALGITLEKIGFANPELIKKMIADDPTSRPDTIEVIESLIKSVKQISPDALDAKTTELIDILERIIVAEKKKKNQLFAQETFKATQIENLITAVKNAGVKTDKIEDTLDLDTKAILLKGLLLANTNVESSEKKRIIDNIDKISRKAKFLGETGCLEFGLAFNFFQSFFESADDKKLKTKEYLIYNQIPMYIKLKPFNPDTLKGYLLSQRKFPYLEKRQREIASLLKNIKTDKSNTECITSYELEKFLNNKHFKDLVEKNNNKPWESAKTENDKFLLIKGFLAVQASNQPDNKALENLKKEFETIFKKSKIAKDHDENQAIEAFQTKSLKPIEDYCKKNGFNIDIKDLKTHEKIVILKGFLLSVYDKENDQTKKSNIQDLVLNITRISKEKKGIHNESCRQAFNDKKEPLERLNNIRAQATQLAIQPSNTADSNTKKSLPIPGEKEIPPFPHNSKNEASPPGYVPLSTKDFPKKHP